MNGKILVAYASQGGSTAEIAEAIGKQLSGNGTVVNVLPVKAVNDISQYQAVIIGSAVHSGKWMPEATEFVRQNQSNLRRIPTAVFQVCMMLATSNEQYKRMVPDWLNPVQSMIHPVSQASFAGALWPDRYTKVTEKLGLRIFLATIKLKAGDYRNWDAIRSWTASLYSILPR